MLKIKTSIIIKWIAIALVFFVYFLFLLAFNKSTNYYHLYISGNGAHVSYEKALVLSVIKESLEPDSENPGLTAGEQEIKIRILTGEHKGKEVEIKNILNYTTNYKVGKGSTVIVNIDSANAENYTVSIYSIDREPFLILLIFFLIVSLCSIAGIKGFKSVIGMVFTFITIAFLFIPMLYRGFSPIVSALAVVILVVFVTLTLLSGLSPKTISAIAGTFAGISASVIVMLIFQNLFQISGYNAGEADSLLAIAGKTRLNVGELLFSSMLISSLGAVMDVAISIASAVNEIYLNDANLDFIALFKSGMNVGRDVIGTMVNTLILVFSGTALNSIILIYSLEHFYYQILNSNFIIIELILSLTGSIGIIFSVPAVAFISAYLIPGFSKKSIKSGKII